MFDDMDEDGNGILDRQELMVMVKKLITKDVSIRRGEMKIISAARTKERKKS